MAIFRTKDLRFQKGNSKCWKTSLIQLQSWNSSKAFSQFLILKQKYNFTSQAVSSLSVFTSSLKTAWGDRHPCFSKTGDRAEE